MNKDKRYVFDTNVIVSALLFKKSPPGQVFYRALGQGKILLSLAVAEELNEVLSREKFKRYLLPEERERFLNALFREVVLVEIIQRVQTCRDQKDDKFLELAINGKAQFIISGDEDLLCLNPFQGIMILKPSDYLASIGKI